MQCAICQISGKEAHSFTQHTEHRKILSHFWAFHYTSTGPSLVPRCHPLTRRNGLVNQVEFLGLAHTFVTVSPSNVQNILRHTCSKKIQILE